MKLIRFCLMIKKDDNMMHSVNDDLRDDLVEVDSDDLILEIFDDLEDLDDESEWILISEICYDESFDDDLDDEEAKYVNDEISKRL